MTGVPLDRNIRPAPASEYVDGQRQAERAEDSIGLPWQQYLPRVLNYVRLRVGDEDLAQDLAAAVFERAVARQHTLRRPGAFGAWLFRIARTTVAGYYRGQRPTLSLDAVGVQPSLDPSPAEAAMQREELARLRAALQALPERDQEVIRLKFAAGLGNQEIGQLMHLRPKHVAVVLFRALEKMRALLSEHD
jgi:RNA polymerase sigma-70 factor (ECF subfamily)